MLIPFLLLSQWKGEIVTSLAYMNHNRNIRQFLDSKVVDVYIRPELGQTLLLDYHKFNEIREIGYLYAILHFTVAMANTIAVFIHPSSYLSDIYVHLKSKMCFSQVHQGAVGQVDCAEPSSCEHPSRS